MARANLKVVPATIRCAIYTRKSTSHGLDQEFNSLEAQFEYCDARVRERAADNWRTLPERYDDGGYTGANTDRPAFQRLMRDVEAEKIDVVIVYKVDRLCRSLLDFAKVMDRFNRANVAFVSVTQNFSTADAMGRLTLNMLMSFAEFEREMIAERTRDKIQAARRRGKWTGGFVPLGYRVEDKRLIIDESTAPLVREIVDLYLELESAVAVAARLNETAPRVHARRRDKIGSRRWTKNDVLRVLQSPVYAGFTGIGDELHEGQHQALIPRPVWQRVQSVLAANRASGRQRPRNLHYILRSVLRCAACGAAMTPAPTRRREREYRYYRCVTRDKGGKAACAAPSLAAEQIEAVVEAELRRLSVDPDVQGAALAAAHARLVERRETLELKRSAESARSATATTEAEVLASRLAACEAGAQSAIERRLAELHEQQSAAEHRRAGLERQLDDVARGIERLDAARSIIKTIDHVWPRLTWASRARLVRTLVERVEVALDGQVRIELASGGGAHDPPEEHRGGA